MQKAFLLSGYYLKSPASVKHRTWVEEPCDCDGETRPARIYTQGCTDPGLPNTEVDILYTAPDGTNTIRKVNTGFLIV